ncbi:MAG: hypothetical protein ACK6CT_06720 [Planctomycetia bacterium]|jgi:hypothetical protein
MSLNPPDAQFPPSLVDRYPPHGFPPYLGLGMLDESSIQLEPGLSVADYRDGDDLVYRVEATDTSWAITEFFDGGPWRRTSDKKTFTEAFFHHLAGQIPTENPRLRALFTLLTIDYRVAVRVRHRTTYVSFPSGYLYAIRLPLTQDNFDAFKAFAATIDQETHPDAPRHIDGPFSVAILKAAAEEQFSAERASAVDVTVTPHRLIETLNRINDFKADAGPIHLRPEIIYAHERHRKYSQVFPGKIARNILAYTVLPIDDDTPPLDDLIDGFIDDSLELYLIVTDALAAGTGTG